MLNTGATINSTAGYSQFLALYREDLSVVLDLRGVDKIKIRFEINDLLSSLEIVNFQIFFNQIDFYMIKSFTFFLFYLRDINRFGIHFNNVENVLQQNDLYISIVCK